MHGKSLVAILLMLFGFLFDKAHGDVDLIRPEITVTEGDRVVVIEWQDPEPLKMVKIHQPRLGTPLQAWRGARIESGGEYEGACDWNFVFGLEIVGDTAKITYNEVADWKKKSTKRDLTKL